MNPGMLLDGATAQTIALAWLRAEIAPVSEYGERRFAAMTPFFPGQEAGARTAAQRIDDVARALDSERFDAIRDTLRNAPDAVGAIARASMGDVLDDANWLELLRFGDAVERVDALIDGAAGIATIANEGVRATMRAIELGRAGKFGFHLSDAFDAGLATARARLAQVQAEFDAVRGRAVAAIARDLGRDDIAGEEFVIMRDALRDALPAGVRVLREAPTYVLCALEYDDATLEALERRDVAADAVAAAEEAVRETLSALVRANAARLDDAARALGEIDVLVAAARFARVHRCVPATIESGASRLAFEDGRYLPLAEELEVEGRPFTPTSVDLHGVAVLTGPNMGGKSVCLRTCGFIVLCAAFGLPVPARRARTVLFDEIAWLGIGSDDATGGLLSSFAKEVVRLRELLERRSPQPFVLIDEFARTTTPQEGKALLVALVERLRASGACAMVATHLGGVALAAGVDHFAVRGLRGIPQRPPTDDLHQALATLADSMDYTIAKIDREDASRADAIALAALLGLDAALIGRAYEALDAPA